MNIISPQSFDKVVASSVSNAFEFDDVAYSSAVPEPSSLVLALVGAVGIVAYKQVRRKGQAVSEKV